jgi:hypothetical protein
MLGQAASAKIRKKEPNLPKWHLDEIMITDFWIFPITNCCAAVSYCYSRVGNTIRISFIPQKKEY